MAGELGSLETYMSGLARPPCTFSSAPRLFALTELALVIAGGSDGVVGDPMTVFRLYLRRSEDSWEDLERNRLRRRCGLGGARKEFRLSLSFDSSLLMSMDSVEVAVDEYGMLNSSGPGSEERLEVLRWPFGLKRGGVPWWLATLGLDSLWNERPCGSFEGAFPMLAGGRM